VTFSDVTALEESEHSLQVLIDAVPVMIAYIDADRKFRFVNSEYAKEWGRPRESFFGMHVSELLDPTRHRSMIDSLDTALAGKSVRHEFELELPGQGRTAYKAATYVPHMADDAAEVRGCYMVFVDLAARRQGERELAGSRRRLKLALQSAQMGCFEWNPLTDESIWDDQMWTTLGLPQGVAVGKKFFELIHPDDIQALDRAVAEALRTHGSFEAEFRIRRPDGEVRWIAARGHVLESPQDGSARMFGLNWDITDQRDAATRLLDVQAHIRLASEAAGFGTYHYDVDRGRIEWSGNLKSILGWPNDVPLDIRPDMVSDLVHPDDRDMVTRRVAEILADTEHDTYSFSHRILRTDGEQRWLRLQGRTFFHPGSGQGRRAQRILGAVLDVTEQTLYQESLLQAQRNAEAANRAKSDFIANISHEIRTPMTAVLGYTQLLAAKEVDPERLEYLDTIQRNGKHLLELMNDILDLSKIEAGKFEVQLSAFGLHELLIEVRSMLVMRARSKGLRFELRYEGAVPDKILSDRKSVKQILVNLLGNAIKFTQHGKVELVIQLLAGESAVLQFDVIDTGVGISSQHQEQLFQPFSQGDASVARRFGGTGLGLDISRRLARRLGGDVVFTSEENRGSTFTCTIAVGSIESSVLVQPQLEATGTFEQPSPQAQSLQCRVLVVDDHSDVRDLACRFLVAAGAQVELSAGGHEALQRVGMTLGGSGPPIDVVLLDMHMPDLDGRTVARQMRGMGFWQPIIALTAEAMHGDMLRCIESGCDGYLSKPIDSEALVAQVAALIAIAAASELEQRRATALASNGAH